MLRLHEFLTGPMAWIAFSIFIGGSLHSLARMFLLIHKKERHIYSYMSLKYSLRSILRWSLPFGTRNMRMHPGMTIATFAFHFCVMAGPVFIASHVVMWEEEWNINFFYVIPDYIGEVMAAIVIVSSLFFVWRRLFLKEVKFVTSASDFVILAIVAAPFITGFLAWRQWGNYPILLLSHILSGEILLMCIPFTRLSHMLFAPFLRAHTGSEFGGVRHAKDW